MDYVENCSDDDAFSSRPRGDVMTKNRYVGDVAPADEEDFWRTKNTFLRSGEREMRKLACLTGVPDAAAQESGVDGLDLDPEVGQRQRGEKEERRGGTWRG